MARKKKRVRQRPEVGQLGKPLTRRSRGCCELCSASEGARPFELWPFPEEPSLDHALMACARCRAWLEGATVEPLQAHFLSTAVWTEEPAVQRAAARLLMQCDDPSNPWMRDGLDAVAHLL